MFRVILLVAFSSTAVPVAAIVSTFGFLSLLGSPTNQLLLIMPFLIMGIGRFFGHDWAWISDFDFVSKLIILFLKIRILLPLRS